VFKSSIIAAAAILADGAGFILDTPSVPEPGSSFSFLALMALIAMAFYRYTARRMYRSHAAWR
jgi:hypothetical protein